jgi:putative spermidine/putrescine transport system ATP-binding protein
MNQGSIEQAAPPLDVYAVPRSPYVARFMGGQNVVKGKVRAIEGDAALLDGPEGSRIRVPLAGRKLAPGGEAYVAIRRDKIVLMRGSDAVEGGENTARGVVETIEYQGIYFKVTLAKLAGEEFIATEAEATFFAHPIKAGEKVVATWQADAVHLLEVDRGSGGSIQPYSEDATS